MPVSLISCSLARDEQTIGTFQVRLNNGTVGAYRLRYNVEMAAPCGPIEIIAQAQASASPDRLPSLWSTYSFENDADLYSFAQKITVERETKSKRHYRIEVDFLPLEPGQQPDGGGEPIGAEPNPLLRKPHIWWERGADSEIHTADNDGNVIRNAAGSLYSDLAERNTSSGICCVEFNVAKAGDVIDLQRRYEDTVNSSMWTFRGQQVPPRSAWIREVAQGLTKNEGQYTYNPVVFRIEIKGNGQTFDISLPEMGQTFYTKTGGAFDLDQYGFRKRSTVGTLVPLALDGTRLDEAAGTPLKTPWRCIREADFNQLTELNR